MRRTPSPVGRPLTCLWNEPGSEALGPQASVLVVFERIFQVFFELTVREHFFETTPRGFATFGRARRRPNAPFHLVEDAVVVGVVFRLGQELFVQIEAFVIPFGHSFLPEKSFENSELRPYGARNEAANYSRIAPLINCAEIGLPAPPERPKWPLQPRDSSLRRRCHANVPPPGPRRN